LIISFNYLRSVEIVGDSSDRITSFASQRIISQTLNFLYSGQEAVDLLDGYLQFKDLEQDQEEIFRFMWNLLIKKPNLASLYIGDELGSFYQVRKEPVLASGAIIRRENGGQTSNWARRDAQYTLLEKNYPSPLPENYDPRDRPWYQNATLGQFYWTNLYIFSSTGEPGITVSIPYRLNNQRIGVIGADISLLQLSSFLQENKVGKEGLVFIFNEGGRIVAYPQAEQAVKEGLPAEIRDLKDDYVLSGYNQYIESLKDQMQEADSLKESFNRLDFRHNDRDYIASFQEFPESFGRNWIIGSIIPDDEVFGPVRSIILQTILISLGIVIISLIFITMLTKSIAEPIVELTEVAERIRDLYLDVAIPTGSYIKEIYIMQSAMMGMRGGLAAFAKYIPRDLVRELIQEGQEASLGGTEKDLTVFFSDITGFTGITETFSAQELMIYLSEYLEKITEIIRDHGGTIDKYIGDGIMAFWGAPHEDPQHALQACKAALAVQKRLGDLNNTWKKEGKPPFPTRIGVHSGSTIIGNVGSTERMNYTIIGDSVNIAARLVELTKEYKTDILISADTAGRLKGKLATRTLGMVNLKGKSEEMEVFALEENEADREKNS
jgi:adenylate cyclase